MKKILFFIGNRGTKKQISHQISIRLILTAMFIIAPAILCINLTPNQNGDIRSILSNSVAALLPVKNFRFYQGKVADFLAGVYDIPEHFSIVEKGLENEKKLNAFQFIAYNTAVRFFNINAVNTIWLTRRFQATHNALVAKKAKNWSLAFKPVSYKEFFSETDWIKDSKWNYVDQSTIPYITVNEGLPKKGEEFKIKRIFADGKTRWFVPKEPFLALMPNLWGNLSKRLPSLEPEEVLPVALIFASRIYNEADGSWNMELLRNYLVAQYRIYAGINLDPTRITVKGKGIRSRFVYEGSFPKNQINVSWFDKEIGASEKTGKENYKIVSVPVPIVNNRRELCFFSSLDVSQSVIIPLSYLADVSDDEFLLSSNGALFSYNDVLEEIELAKENMKAVPREIYPSKIKGYHPPNFCKISSMVTPTKRHRIIANRLIAGAKSYEEALVRIKSFFEQTLPYQTDNKELGWNVDIPMTTLLTYINGGGDCEDHAIPYATTVMAADLPVMHGYNKYVAIHESYLVNRDNETVGHANPLVYIPNRKPVTFPFPDHIKVIIDGQEMNFYQIEATGLGEDEIGVNRMQRYRFESNVVDVISGVGKTRKVASAGFSQFEY